MNLARLLIAIGATTTGFQRSIAAAERRVDALERRTNGLRKGFGRAAGGMAAFAKKAMFLGAVVLTALTLALGGVINASIQYEDAFAGVRKTVEATEPELKQLSRDIREMSTVIPVAATVLAGLAETAGALGVPTKNIKEFVRVTAMLGLTTNVTSAEAADALGRLGNILGLTADDYSRFASALVALGNAGASTEAEILEITKRMGAAGKVAGLTTPQIIGWASALASVAGMEPERAGTSMQMFLLSVTKIASLGGKKLTLLSKTAGLSGKAFKKLFAKDASGALMKFITGLDKLAKGDKLKVLSDLGFNDSGITRALLGLASSHEVVARQLGISTAEYEKNIAAQAELDKRLATTKSQLALLGNILLDLGMTLGDIFLPLITPLIKGLNEWITANKTLITQIITQLAAGIVTVVTAVAGWIGQNGPLIYQIGTALVGALRTIWTVITTQVIPALFGSGGKGGIIPAVIELGSKIADWLIPKVMAFIDTLTKPDGVIQSVLKVAGPVVGQLIGGFGKIVDALFGTSGSAAGHPGSGRKSRGLIPALGDLAGALWGDGKGPLALAVKALAWFFGEVLGPAIAKLMGDVTRFIDRLTDAIKLIQSFLGKVGDVAAAGGGPQWATEGIPGNAMGGAVGPRRRGGISWVGEEGPELVKWGANGYVTPADLSADAMAGSSGGRDGDLNLTIHNPEPRAAEADIGRAMRRLEGIGLVARKRAGAW